MRPLIHTRSTRYSAMSFADKCKALTSFFGLDTTEKLAARIASMNEAMGVVNVATTSLPEQIDRLVEMTGISVSTGVGGETSSSQQAEPDLMVDDDELGTSLPMGSSYSIRDKRAEYLQRHKLRELPSTLVDERGAKVREFQLMMEGSAEAPEKYRHGDHFDDGRTQIAGGYSLTPSMTADWASPSFFKDACSKLASRPPIRRCHPVEGKFPEFR